jgi:DNA-binding beta-propeller fold protein YncE
MGLTLSSPRLVVNRSEAYVSNEGQVTISVADLKTLAVVGSIRTQDMPHNVRFSEVGIGHAGIDVTPDGRYAITGAIGDKVVSVIDTESLAVVMLFSN